MSKGKSKEFNLLSIYLSFELITDLILSPISKTIFKSEFIAAHIFTLVEFFIFASLFRIISKEKSKNFIFIIFSSVFTLIFFYENFISINRGFDSLSVGTSNIILTANAIICLSQFLKTTKSENILHPNFFILSSSVIYFSGTLFIYTLFNSYVENKNFNDIYYLINPIVIAIRNIMLVIGIIYNLSLKQKEKMIAA
ncbi:MAG: hypothetical protein ACK5EP_05730 [Bacteroidota bacterium]